MKNRIKQIGIFIALLPVYFYRICISPWTPASCRYTPSCSEYAIIAVKKYGPFKGGWLTLKRILRCLPGVATAMTRFLKFLSLNT
jgi:putative membrane protein insertion efficiency factor